MHFTQAFTKNRRGHVSSSVFPIHKLPSLPKYLCRGDPWGNSWYHQILRSTYKVRVDLLRGRNRHGIQGVVKDKGARKNSSFLQSLGEADVTN